MVILVKKEFKFFKEKIDEIIKEKTEYKTSAEENEAYTQIERGVRLDNEISKVLAEARNKEGKFEKPNSKYF